MATTLAHGYAAPAIYGGLVRLAAERAAAFAGRIGREWQLRQDVRAVSALSDAALADMGIGRGFAAEAVRHGRGRRAADLVATSPVGPVMGAGWTEWR